MNIPNIQNFFVQKKIEKKSTQFKPSNTNKIKTIILVIDESQQDFKTKILFKIKEMGIDESKLSVLIYCKTLEKEKKYEFPTFSNASFSNFGLVKSEDLKTIFNKSFDLLITFYQTKNILLDYVILKINSDFKVGLTASQNQNFHLAVNCTTNDVKTYLNETFKYLKILNKL
jgi:hypothetical protein